MGVAMDANSIRIAVRRSQDAHRRLRWPWLLVLAGLLGGGLAVAGPNNSRMSLSSVVLPAGRSTLLQFQHMRRVEVVEPDVLAVVVTSFNALSLVGKKPGTTSLYVWDNAGVHQYEVMVVADSPAEKTISDLRRVLGTRLTYTAYGDSTVIVEGVLPPADGERARSIIARPLKSDVQIIDLIRTEGETTTGAVAMCAALDKTLGNKLQYIAWNDTTVLVQGTLSDQTALERARRLLTAVNKHGVSIVDLIEVNPCVGEAPLEDIAKAVGDRYRVWQIQGRTVGIDGVVTSQAELAVLNKVLESFSEQARVVNLVQIVEPKPDVNALAAVLQQMVGNTLTVRPLSESALALDGTVSCDSELKRIGEVVASYPVPCKVVNLLRVALPERKQIVCHVRVVEINKTELDRLGINWGQISYSGGTPTFVDQPWLIQNLSGLVGREGNGLQNVLPLGAQISLLAQKLCARVLSEPNLMVDDGGIATMLVGGEIPVPIAQGTGGGTAITVEWKQFGVQLNIEPHILEDGQKINLKIAPEVSSLDFSNAISIGGFLLPALRSRKASTVVTMAAGDTLVLGGLLQTEDVKAIRKVPLLGDLPIIGQLFRRKEFTSGQSELIIMVTPEIVAKGPTCFR